MTFLEVADQSQKQELKTHCKSHTNVFKAGNLFSDQSVLVVIFNYPAYRKMALALVFCPTRCLVIQIKPCEVAEHLDREIIFWNFVPPEGTNEQVWKFSLLQSTCALFTFHYEQKNTREFCALAFHHRNVKTKELHLEYGTSIFMRGNVREEHLLLTPGGDLPDAKNVQREKHCWSTAKTFSIANV